MGQQISYLKVIVVHSTMHLMHHNHCQITTIIMCVCVCMIVCVRVCVCVFVCMFVFYFVSMRN